MLQIGGNNSLILASNNNTQIAIATGQTLGTTTLAGMPNLAGGFTTIYYNGMLSANSAFVYRTCMPRLSIIDSNTVGATRNTSDASFGVTASAQTTVWNPSYVKSCTQYGGAGATIGAASLTQVVTLSPAVVAANSIILYGGTTSTNNSDNHTTSAVRATMNAGGTTVTLTREATGGTTITTFIVLEFIPSVIVQNQRISPAVPAAASSNTAAVTAPIVSANNCLLLYNGWSCSLGNDKRALPGIGYTSGTTVSITRGAALAGVVSTVSANLVEFNSAFINQRQNATCLITGATTTGNSTLSPAVFSDKSMLAWGGCYFPAGSDVSNAGSPFMNLTLSSTTNVRGTRGSASAQNTDSPFNILQFS